MSKLTPEKQFLSALERLCTGIIGIFVLGYSVILVFNPPIRQTIVNDSGVIQTTTSNSDQSTVVISLITAGSILVFYAINGLRLVKFTAGLISGESESSQGSTKPLNPSPQNESEITRHDEGYDEAFESLPDSEKKILRTLWRYQKLNYGDNFEIRWTFKVIADQPNYRDYLNAISGLLGKGYITINPENEQVCLTNEGIILMRSIGDKVDKGDIYFF